jgi:hypothetical protein
MPKRRLPRFPRIRISFGRGSSRKAYVPAIGILNAKIGEGNSLNVESWCPMDVELLNEKQVRHSFRTLPRGRYEVRVEYDLCIAWKKWKRLYADAILFWWGHKRWGHLNLRTQYPCMGVFVHAYDEKALRTAQHLYDKMTFSSHL